MKIANASYQEKTHTLQNNEKQFKLFSNESRNVSELFPNSSRLTSQLLKRLQNGSLLKMLHPLSCDDN